MPEDGHGITLFGVLKKRKANCFLLRDKKQIAGGRKKREKGEVRVSLQSRKTLKMAIIARVHGIIEIVRFFTKGEFIC